MKERANLMRGSLPAASILTLITAASTGWASELNSPSIAIVGDGPSIYGDALLSRTQRELAGFGYPTPGTFPVHLTSNGAFASKEILRNLDAALADPEVSVVWAFGFVASAAAARRALEGELPKPVIAPFLLDPARRALEKRSLPNLSFIPWSGPLASDLKRLQALQPVHHLAYLLPSAMADVWPALGTLIAEEGRALGLDVSVVSDASLEAGIRSLPSPVDAVYVGPDLGREAKEVSTLAKALLRRKLSSFSAMGAFEVRRGLLMSVRSQEHDARLARLVAVYTDAILRGEEPARLRTPTGLLDSLTLNEATAQALGRSPAWSLLSEAETVGANHGNARKLSLEGVVKEVVERNLTLRGNDEVLATAQLNVREAIGALLPSLDVSLTGSLKDPDGANGLNPERSLAWSGNASQILFDEPAVARLQINEHLREATRYDNRAAVLDVVQGASIGYLGVLRALANEQIQRENLKVTRAQLAQAELRSQVGSGTRSEVLRLESQLANNRRSVIEAVASRNVAEIELRQFLNDGSEAALVPEDVSLQSSKLMGSGHRLQRFMRGPGRFRILRAFMAEEALRNAPELQASGARLKAQRRQALSRKLAPFLPQIALSGGVTHTFATGGTGTEPEAQVFFPFNEVNWQVGITATLKIFEGTSRYSRIRKEEAEARRQALDLQRRRVQTEASVRTALHQAGASYAAIELQTEAAAAADENLALVQEGYARGKRDIITLIDAQNQALSGRLSANSAVYDFLVDLLAVQRATGGIDLLMSETDVRGFFDRLQAFEAAGASP